MSLNHRTADLCDEMAGQSARLRIEVHRSPSGARLIDCGVQARGGLQAGLWLARACMASLGDVRLAPGEPELHRGPAVMVSTDHPVAACMAAQYAGWQIASGKFFSMGSGPMRAAAGKEAIFTKIGLTERPTVAVGVLETGQLPPDDVCRQLAEQCGVAPNALTLLVAPTSSQAGGVQIVARSVETALHKLFELEFDLSRIESGFGIAPLPPVAANDLAAIGRTNDSILYGAEVTLWVRGDDASLEAIGPRVPSSSSADFGQPFSQIFERYNRDFYKIDPHLFSPATVTFQNLDSGRTFRFGHTLPRVIHASFG